MFAAPFLVWKDLEAGEAGGEAGLTGCDQTAGERSLGKTGWRLEAAPRLRTPPRAPRPRGPKGQPPPPRPAGPPGRQTPAAVAGPCSCLRRTPKRTPTASWWPFPPPAGRSLPASDSDLRPRHHARSSEEGAFCCRAGPVPPALRGTHLGRHQSRWAFSRRLTRQFVRSRAFSRAGC